MLQWLRRFRFVLVVLGIGFLAHAGTPAIAVWQIREAARTGDLATLRKRVDWVSVRQSMKSSLAETRKAVAEIAQDSAPPKRSIWQKIRVAALPYITEPLIDRYFTPEGIVELFALRAKWRDPKSDAAKPVVRPGPLASTPLAGTTLDRAMAFGRRVRRYALVSPGRVEIEIVDRDEAGRRWQVAFEMRGVSWLLTEIRALGREATAAKS